MALLAIPVKSGQSMIGINRPNKIIQMTTHAIDGRCLELVPLLVDMTGFAIRARMSGQQREQSVLVPLQHQDAIIPALADMTALTILTQLTLVRVGMAIGASAAYIGKDEALMTAHTGPIQVPALQ